MPRDSRPSPKCLRKFSTRRKSANPDVKREIDQLFANLLWIRREIREDAPKGTKEDGP